MAPILTSLAVAAAAAVRQIHQREVAAAELRISLTTTTAAPMAEPAFFGNPPVPRGTRSSKKPKMATSVTHVAVTLRKASTSTTAASVTSACARNATGSKKQKP